jgi:hypothetical protein
MLGPVEMLGHWTRKFVLTSHWVRQNWNRSEAFRILWNILKHRHTEVAYPVTDCPFCIVFRRQRKTNPSLKQQHYRVEWFRQLIGGLLLRTARSSHRSVHVELWCEEVALRQLMWRIEISFSLTSLMSYPWYVLFSFFYSKCIFFVLLVALTVSKRWWVQANLASVIPLQNQPTVISLHL